jgi:hypothetical protein
MITKAKVTHTPGPWTLGRFGSIVGGPFIKYANGEAQSQLASATVGNEITPEEREANARLIAAAPDLLLMLERITARMNRWASHGVQCGPKGIDHDYSELYNYAQAAIRKAKGE